MNIARFAEADLQELLDQEDAGDFVAGYLASLAARLNRKPEGYRAFGPYWWPIKRLLIEAGHDEFGTEVDDDTADALTYSTPALTVAAAYAFNEHVFRSGMAHANAHTVATDDGDMDTYLIVDEEIEGPETARRIMKGGGIHGSD